MARIHKLDNYKYFKKDIQGSSTNIYPIVVIGNYPNLNLDDYFVISTNSNYLKQENYQIRPLLLSIPSLKESIDIESKKYKISSVSLDISNYEYEGERFSDIFSENSLINTECRIYWASQSIEKLQVSYISEENANNLELNAFPIYFGKIRRYEHSLERVKLTLEDMSQEYLHRDLPLPNTDSQINWLSDGNNVPDQYKNKPIPQVYGHVDRSPMVSKVLGLGRALLFDSNSEDSKLSNDSQMFNDGYHSYSTFPVFAYKDNKYLSLQEQFLYVYNYMSESPYNWYYQEVVNAVAEGAYQWNDLQNGSIELFNNFFFRSDIHQAITIANPSQISLFGYTTHGYAGELSNASADELINITDYDPNTTFEASGEFTVLQSTHEIPNGEAGFANNFNNSLHFYYDSPKTLGSRPLTLIINDKALRLGTVEFTEGSDGELEIVSSTIIFIRHDQNLNEEDEQKFKDHYDSEGSHVTIYNLDDVDGVDMRDLIELKTVGNGEDVTPTTALQFLVSYNPNLTIQYSVPHMVLQVSQASEKPAISIRYEVFSWFTEPDNQDINAYINGLVRANIQEVRMAVSVDIESGQDKKFFADVNGRLMQNNLNPNVPQVILSILNKELEIDSSKLPELTEDYLGEYSDWSTQFTIDKKINSKTLIEHLSSASAYMIRVNNLGEVAFNKIHLNYNGFNVETDQENGSENHIIKESHIIDYSFTRTKIEDVKTKIELKYKHDYGLNKLNRTTNQITVEQLFGEGVYNYDYYGLKDDHSGSTLIIDDSRGKYIRDDSTANKLATWLLSWYANQHLILNVKLPLSKGLNLEVGDIVQFLGLPQNHKAYGINYSKGVTSILNGQTIQPYFIITETNKSINSVSIKCIQLHTLHIDECSEGYDCTGSCGGSAQLDACGVCGGNNQDESSCDDCLEGFDCLGECGGSAILDECGVCNGTGYYPCPMGEDDICDPNNCLPDTSESDGVCSSTLYGNKQECENNGYTWSAGCYNTCSCYEIIEPCENVPALNKYNPPYIKDVSFIDNYKSLNQDQLGLHCNNINFSQILLSSKDSFNFFGLYKITWRDYANNSDCDNLLWRVEEATLTVSVPPNLQDIVTIQEPFSSGITATYSDNNDVNQEQNIIFDGGESKAFFIQSIDEDGIPFINYDPSSLNNGDVIKLITKLDLKLSRTDNDSIYETHFWQDQLTYDFEFRDCPLPGDLNGDGVTNILDIVSLANCVLNENCNQLENGCAGDVNNDGFYNVLDVVTLVNCVLHENCNG